MTIMIDEHLLALWSAPIPGPQDADFLAGLSRDPASGPDAYAFIWRIKVFASPAPFDPRDSRLWKGYTLHGKSDAEVVEKVRGAVRQMVEAQSPGEQYYEVLRAPGESDEALARRIGSMPFAHMKKATEQEVREYEAQIRAAEAHKDAGRKR